jgi:hypothetical protein
LIKEADAFDRPDSRGESSWIASWDPFPVPIVSESKIDWIVDQHPWMNFHSRNLFAIELPCRRELISCRVSLPAIDGCFGEAEESSAAWWFTTGSLLVCFCFSSPPPCIVVYGFLVVRSVLCTIYTLCLVLGLQPRKV